MERLRILRVELTGNEGHGMETIIFDFVSTFQSMLLSYIHFQVISVRGHHIDAAKIKIIYASSRQWVGALLRDHIDRRWQGKARQHRL